MQISLPVARKLQFSVRAAIFITAGSRAVDWKQLSVMLSPCMSDIFSISSIHIQSRFQLYTQGEMFSGLVWFLQCVLSNIIRAHGKKNTILFSYTRTEKDFYIA